MREAAILIIFLEKLQIIPNIDCTYAELIVKKTRGEKSVIRRFK
jgi:hypothetical protein